MIQPDISGHRWESGWVSGTSVPKHTCRGEVSLGKRYQHQLGGREARESRGEWPIGIHELWAVTRALLQPPREELKGLWRRDERRYQKVLRLKMSRQAQDPADKAMPRPS